MKSTNLMRFLKVCNDSEDRIDLSRNHILEKVFVRRFLIEENNSYEELLEVIKNRYSNLTVKRLFSCHGIKKRRSVADRTVAIRLV